MAGKQKSTKSLIAQNRYGSAPKAVRNPPKPPRSAAPKQRNILARALRWLFNRCVGLIWAVIWRSALLLALFTAAGVGYYRSTLPDLSALLDVRARGSVTLLDRNNEVFAWRGEQFGEAIDAQSISPHLRHAVLATEDKRFYRHFGLSPRGVLGAIRINMREGRSALSGHGGSTITQQTAKLLCLGLPFDRARWKSERAYEAECRESSLWRKVKEAVYALALESRFSKDEILTIYINRSFLGAGARGFEAAAQRYFGKSARNVNPAEAAMLAGLLVAPTRYAPTNDLQRSQNRAGVIINLMQAQALLSAEEADFARKNPAQLSQAAKANAGNYFADWVMQSGPRFLTQTTTEDVIIKTTFDRRLQNAAEQAMHQIFDSKVRPGSKAQAAIVVMSPNGAVRAMLGGRNTSVAGGFNRATQALRQTGSAFKPFVYAAALEAGYSPYDIVQDSPLTLDLPGSGPWSPQNYSKEFLGPVSLNTALSQSLNIPTIRLSEEVGRDVVRNVASGFGVGEKLASGPALALGVSEATLIDMVGAYAGILNRGISITPFGLNELRLFGEDTALMGATNSAGQRVISPTAAHNLIFMMQNVMVEGTGQKAAIEGWQTAGKTGTTQSARDAWFIGFSSNYVIGVWMGYDDNTSLTGVTGGGLPAEIWKATMLRAQGGLPPSALVQTPQTHSEARKPSKSMDQDQSTNAINRFLRKLFGQN